jgi:PAS domain-containing protein
VVAHLGASQDITGRKRESTAREQAFPSDAEANVVISITLSDGIIEYCNQQAASLLGTTPETILG